MICQSCLSVAQMTRPAQGCKRHPSVDLSDVFEYLLDCVMRKSQEAVKMCQEKGKKWD